jgi:hypothetical protein
MRSVFDLRSGDSPEEEIFLIPNCKYCAKIDLYAGAFILVDENGSFVSSIPLRRYSVSEKMIHEIAKEQQQKHYLTDEEMAIKSIIK